MQARECVEQQCVGVCELLARVTQCHAADVRSPKKVEYRVTDSQIVTLRGVTTCVQRWTDHSSKLVHLSICKLLIKDNSEDIKDRC